MPSGVGYSKDLIKCRICCCWCPKQHLMPHFIGDHFDYYPFGCRPCDIWMPTAGQIFLHWRALHPQLKMTDVFIIDRNPGKEADISNFCNSPMALYTGDTSAEVYAITIEPNVFDTSLFASLDGCHQNTDKDNGSNKKPVKKAAVKRHLEPQSTPESDPVHMDIDKDSTICEQCHKKITISSWRNHILTHWPEDKLFPYSCGICYRGFKLKKSVLDHIDGRHFAEANSRREQLGYMNDGAWNVSSANDLNSSGANRSVLPLYFDNTGKSDYKILYGRIAQQCFPLLYDASEFKMDVLSTKIKTEIE